MKQMKQMNLRLLIMCLCVALMGTSCVDSNPNADRVIQAKQEQSIKNAVEEIGLPSTPNHTELKQLKDIYEKRDNPKIIHYAYLQSVMTGKLIYLGKCIGYGIPYATQFSSPQKDVYTSTLGHFLMPQAEPNGLFMPSDSRGTWVMLLNPNDVTAAAEPVYIEGDVAVSPFRLPTEVIQ